MGRPSVHAPAPLADPFCFIPPKPQNKTTTSFEDLARRFEAPDSRNRWDAPLFVVRPAGDSPAAIDETLAAVAAVLTGAASAPGAAAGAAAATGQALRPTVATTTPGLLGTNVLHEIESAAQVCVNGVWEVWVRM